MSNGKVNPYRIAPTWLFNNQGKTKLFQTQDEVDEAWESGWFGPKNRLKIIPILSGEEWTKAELAAMVAEDPRYNGFKVNRKDKVEDIRLALVEWETTHGLSDKVVEKEED